jgi:hypothetical protein
VFATWLLPRRPVGDGVTVIVTLVVALYGAGVQAKVPLSRLTELAAWWEVGQRRRSVESAREAGTRAPILSDFRQATVVMDTHRPCWTDGRH